MNPFVFCALSIALISGQVLAADEEPTAEEMLGAIKQRFAAGNARIQEMQQRCAQSDIRNSNDPMFAMQCASLAMVGVGTSGGMQVEVSDFEKIACAKADGQPGYVCDYYLGMSTNSPAMGGATGDMMRQGSAGQGRFIKRQNGWLFLPNEQQ